MARFLLVHSPLLGPYSLAPATELLRAGGHEVAVPDLRSALTGPPPYYPRLRVAAVAAAGGGAGRLTLVGHSAAGPFLPAIADALAPAVATVALALLGPDGPTGEFHGRTGRITY